MKRYLLPLIAVMLALSGCLPVELEVSSDGRVLIPRAEGFFTLDPATGQTMLLYKPKTGQPVFGRFMPDGKSLLAVTEGGGGPAMPGMPGMGGGDSGTQKMQLVTLADGSAKPVASAGNVTYLTVSPDGKSLAYTRVSDEGTQLGPDKKENLPELHVVDIASGADKKVAAAGAVAGMHRWYADSSAILVFHIEKKVEDNYQGTLMRVETATGKTTELARALGGNDVSVDISADGKWALFVADDGQTPDADPTQLKAAKDEIGHRLFLLDLAAGKLKPAEMKVAFGRFSPSGKKLLVIIKGEESASKLEVGNADGTSINPVANDALLQISSGPGNNDNVYPNWIRDDAVAYLSQRAVFGTAGKNLELRTVGADGKNARSWQSTIDAEADKARK